MTITKAITQASERKNGLSSQLGFVLICNAELMQMTVNAPRLSNLSVRMSTVERPKTPLRYSYHCRGYNNNYKVVSLKNLNYKKQQKTKRFQMQICQFYRTKQGNLQHKQRESVSGRRDLGLLITPGLSWNENCEARVKR